MAVAAGLTMGATAPAQAPAAAAPSPAAAVPSKGRLVQHVTGMFDVKLTPQPASEDPGRADLGRMIIDKQYHGSLDGTGKGEMLTGMTAVKNSGAYVAVERVSGTLAGKHGTFILQHHATMTRGKPDLNISVVPDSGTGDLTGISGRMGVRIENGQHFYDFAFSLSHAQ
jgi:hypothetical protein